MQKAKLADAPTSTSAKTVKSTTKPRKKGSHLDEIRKDPDALYALIKMISKEKVVVDLEDKRSYEASITKHTAEATNMDPFHS